MVAQHLLAEVLEKVLGGLGPVVQLEGCRGRRVGWQVGLVGAQRSWRTDAAHLALVVLDHEPVRGLLALGLVHFLDDATGTILRWAHLEAGHEDLGVLVRVVWHFGRRCGRRCGRSCAGVPVWPSGRPCDLSGALEALLGLVEAAGQERLALALGLPGDPPPKQDPYEFPRDSYEFLREP